MDASFLIGLVISFGYLGVFLASLIGSASIFLPVPSFLIVTAAGTTLNPVLVGVAAGLGAAIGELVGYLIGLGLLYGKKKIGRKKEHKYTKLVKRWFAKKKGPAIIFIFALTPLPDDIVGVVCGAIKYDVKKFFLATLAGKILLHIALAYAGLYGLEIIRSLFFA